MLPELSALQYFHFLRPAWGLLLLPWLIIIIMQSRRQSRQDMFDGIIAPHLLEHLRIRRFESRWLNPRNFTVVMLLLISLVLLDPACRSNPPHIARQMPKGWCIMD